MGIKDRDYYWEAVKERENTSRFRRRLQRLRIPPNLIWAIVGGLIGLAGAIIEDRYFR